jgi:transposase InsO family protein
LLEDVLEESRQKDIASKTHIGKSNHRGIQENCEALKRKYYWPNMTKTVSEIINTCLICNSAKYERRPLNAELQLVPITTKPFEKVFMDILTINKEKYLTIIDSFSKYAQAYLLTAADAISVAKALRIYFSHHGTPQLLISDQGQEFKNNVVQELLDMYKVKTHFTTIRNPQSNGSIERFHSTLLEHVRIQTALYPRTSTYELVINAIIAYNSSIHSMTNKTPFEIVSGHLDSQDPLDINKNKEYIQQYVSEHKKLTESLYKSIHDFSTERHEKQISYHNKDREPLPSLSPGQIVFEKADTRQKTEPRYKVQVIKEVDPLAIDLERGRRIARHNVRRPLKNTINLFQGDDNDDSGSESSTGSSYNPP